MREREPQRRKFRLLPAQAVLAIIISACSPQGSDAMQTFEPKPTPEKSGIVDLDFPLWTSDIYLINGPHYSGREDGVRYALDFSSAQKIPCSPGDRKSIDDARVVASKYGTITVAGGRDKNDRNNPEHSIVKIDVGDGYSLEYVHLDKISVAIGQIVHRNDTLGVMSCEVPGPSPKFPKGGSTDEISVHFGIEKDGEPIPIQGTTFAEWEVKEGQNPGEGFMKKKDRFASPNYTVTADMKRCGPSQDSIRVCNGIRNDLPHPKMARPGVIGPGNKP